MTRPGHRLSPPRAMVSPFLLPAFLLVLAMLPFATDLWYRLLDCKAGRFWPVPAALLPPILAITSRLQSGSPLTDQLATASVLLTAIAFFQVYGQARAERYRKAAEDRLNEQATLLDAIGIAISEQGPLLVRIADGVAPRGPSLRARQSEGRADFGGSATNRGDQP